MSMSDLHLSPREMDSGEWDLLIDRQAEMLLARIGRAERHPAAKEWEWERDPKSAELQAMGRLYAEVTSAFPELGQVIDGMSLPAWAYMMGYVVEAYRKHFEPQP